MIKKVVAMHILILALAIMSISNAEAFDKQIDQLKSEVLNASKQYKTEVEKLSKLNEQMPGFIVQGEINQVKGKELYLWGIAVGSSNAQNPGWQIKEGNILVLNPDSKKINYIVNLYADSNHYYLRTENGKNAFGSKVPVKVYTKTVPAALKIQQDRAAKALKVLNTKGLLLEKHARDKYLKLLSSTSSASALKVHSSELQKLHQFLKQSTINNSLYVVVESYLNKIIKSLPKDMETMYLLAEFHGANGFSNKAIKVYESIAKAFPSEFAKRVNEKTDVWFVADTLMRQGHPSYSVAAIEKYMKDNPKTQTNKNILEKYIKYLYAAAKTMSDKDVLKKDVLEKSRNLIVKHQFNKYASQDDQMMYGDISKMLSRIYALEGNVDKSAEIIEEAGVGNFIAKENRFENEKEVLALAEGYAKKGDYKNSFKYFDLVVGSYNLYTTFNQNKDVKLSSDNDYSNLLLGLAYLSHTRLDGEEAEYAIKYISKAYAINPLNSMTNNALGFLYKNYYIKTPERFDVLTKGLRMTHKELVIKVVGYFNEAVRLKPDYKKAYGNLYKVYAEDYESEVRAALEEIHRIGKNDYDTYYSTIKSLKDTYFEKSKNKSGFSQSGIEGLDDF